MSVERAFCTTKGQAEHLLEYGLSEKSVWFNGRSAETLDRCLATFRGDLDSDGIAWRSITEPHLNNATAVGRLMLNVTGAMAQFERDQIKDRTKRGMDELKRKGVALGRKRLFDKKQTAKIKRDRKTMTREETAAKWKCSPGTIDKYAA